MKRIPYYLVSLLIGFALAITLSQVLAAFSEPSSAPPGGNTQEPLNASSATQFKSGVLGIGGLFTTDTTTFLSQLSGNVGIGTTDTQGAKLRVAGDVRWTGSLTEGWVPWGRLSSIPEGFADGVDNTGGDNRFGGMYSDYEYFCGWWGNNVYCRACQYGNPLSGGSCSCPSGFSPVTVLDEIHHCGPSPYDKDCADFLYMCYK